MNGFVWQKFGFVEHDWGQGEKMRKWTLAITQVRDDCSLDRGGSEDGEPSGRKDSRGSTRGTQDLSPSKH